MGGGEKEEKTPYGTIEKTSRNLCSRHQYSLENAVVSLGTNGEFTHNPNDLLVLDKDS